jgi:hypothetical protein
MGKTKNLDQLLKELNEMQMQFDNLKDEMVTKDNKRKKNQIKTELASDKIDTDFFKTLTTAPKINNNTASNKQLDNQKKIESNTDNLLFSLDIEHEEITNKKQENSSLEQPIDVIDSNNVISKIKNSIEKTEELTIDETIEVNNSVEEKKEFINDDFEDSKEIIESKPIEKKLTKNEDLLNKEENINTNIQNIKSKKEIDIIKEKKNIDNKVSEKSFLSIKQKLDKIKKEIAARELEISNKKDDVVQITQEKNKIPTKELKISNKKDNVKITQEKKETDIVAEKVLAPKISPKIERKGTKKTNKTQSLKQDNKTKKRDTVDVLTIIILVLLIVLIITAWALLK